MKKRMKLHHLRPYLASVLTVFVLVPLLICCSGPQQNVSKSGFYFDTIITITLYHTSNEGYIDQCFAMASEYERKLSNTVTESEIAEINRKAGHYVTVSDETLELILAGIHYGNLSNGLFDITIGKLTALWDIPDIAKNLENSGNETDASTLPSPDAIRRALAHVDYQKIAVKENKVKLKDSAAALDLGGIAKGFIADKMREYLNGEGVTAGIINLGGNVLTLGEKPDGNVYSIGIQKPFAESGSSLGTLTVKDASVVSSGIYERYYRVNDRIYHHILDPFTGYPVENTLAQVTIISKSSMDGDALSTTCFSLGLTDGMALVESLKDVDAVFVTTDGSVYLSSGFGGDITFQETP